MNITADLLMKGRLVKGELTPASAWDSTTSHTLTVPAGKIWINPHGYVKRNASGTLLVRKYSATPTVVYVLASYGAGTSGVNFPDEAVTGTTPNQQGLLRFDAGEKLVFTFGAAQGAGAEINYFYWEIDA